MDNHSLMSVWLCSDTVGYQCAVCGATFEREQDGQRPCSQPDMPTPWDGWRPASAGTRYMPELPPALRADAGQAAPRPPTHALHPGEAVSAAAVQMTAALDALEAALAAGEIGISPWNRTDLEMLRAGLRRAERMWPSEGVGDG